MTLAKGRAFSLLSGGLDSLLATRLIMDQGIEVVGLHFITPFFGYQKKGREAESQERWRRLYGISARVIDVSEEYFQIVRNPRYGYGKNFNPCIDCKIFFFSQARGIMETERADFLVTGEVLGQRPMSQRRDTLRIVERDSRTEGILLRPLSARKPAPTRPEQMGVVDREKLLALSGRSRKPQIALAEQMGIRQYPSPAGGCLLTDPVMARRVRNYFRQSPAIQAGEVLLLQFGRHFHLPGGAHLVVGRMDLENQRLKEFWKKGDYQIQVKGIPGPLGLLRGAEDEASLQLAAAIVARYSKAKERETVEIQYGQDMEVNDSCLEVRPARDEEIVSYRF